MTTGTKVSGSGHEKSTKVENLTSKILLVGVVVMMMTLVCISTAGSVGKPDGYVGGTIAPNGDVIGGHPSEEQMAKDRAAAGVSVIVTDGGKRIFSGENAVQFAIMDKRV